MSHVTSVGLNKNARNEVIYVDPKSIMEVSIDPSWSWKEHLVEMNLRCQDIVVRFKTVFVLDVCEIYIFYRNSFSRKRKTAGQMNKSVFSL